MNPILAHWMRPKECFAVLLAIWLFGCTAFQFHAFTQYGKQCPTASVQLIREEIRDCCGKLVAVQKRAPKPGEGFFMQCRCSEKEKIKQGGLIVPKLEPFFLTPVSLDMPELPGSSQDIVSGEPGYLAASAAPIPRPPSLS